MKLKSPFNLFSLSAPTADLRGNYANPQIGKYKPTTFKHPKLSDIKSKKGSIDIPEIGSNTDTGSETDMITTTKNVLGSNQGNTGNSYAKSYSGLSKDEGGNAKATGDFKGGNLTDWTSYVKDYNSKKNSK